MRGMLRLGRYAVRAGQSAPQQGQPQRFGIVGTLLAVLFLISIGVAYPRIVLAIVAALVIAGFPLAVVVGKAELARKDKQVGELDRIMAAWDEERRP